jgi:hypothetical protein
METPDPGRIVAQDVRHAIDQFLARRAVLHRLDLLEQPVVFGILIVRRIFARLLDLALLAVQQEQEIFRIGIVGIPAEVKQLHRTLAHLFLEAVVVGAAHHQLRVDLGELLVEPVDARLGADAGGRRVEIDHQRFAGFRTPPIGPAGLGQQALGLGDRLAPRLAVDPVVHVGIDPRRALAVTENARRNRPLGGDAAPVLEDRDELFLVDGDRDRLAQLACMLGSFRVGPAHQRVQPVETHVHA